MRDWVTIVFFLLSGLIAVRKKSLVTVYLVKLVLIVPGILLLLVRSEVELVPGLGQDPPSRNHRCLCHSLLCLLLTLHVKH